MASNLFTEYNLLAFAFLTKWFAGRISQEKSNTYGKSFTVQKQVEKFKANVANLAFT